MFGVLGMVELVDHVRLRRPEAARERDELRGRDVLRAQRQHLVVVERALELGERARRSGPARRSKPDASTPKPGGQRVQFQHGAALLDPVRCARVRRDGHAAPGSE